MFDATPDQPQGAGAGSAVAEGAERILHLNVLPIRLGLENGSVLSAERDHERDHALREHPDSRRAFQVYSHLARTYIWPLPGGGLPDLSSAWSSEEPRSLPQAVVAFAVREAAIVRLVRDHNFEALSGRLLAPTRLYRRRHNLAAFPGLQPDPRAAIFPLLLVQGIVLGEGGATASAGLILDVRTIQRIEATLAELETAGVRIAGLHVHWAHGDGCACPEPPRGFAGAVVGGDVLGDLTLVRRGTFGAPARCLRANATATLVARYLSHLRGRPPAQVEKRLAAAVQQEVSGARLWQLLSAVQRTLSPVAVLGGVSAELDPAARADGAAEWPRHLAPAREPVLNFRYGAPLIASGAGAGLRKFGPYDQATRGRTGTMRAIVLAARTFNDAAQNLARALDGGIANFRGMKEQFKLESFTVEVQLLDGDNADTYRTAATAIAQSRQRPDVVFPIVRWADRYLPVARDPYKAVKAVLAARDIASQAMTVELLSTPQSSLQWSISAMSVSVYAKVGNVPWVLHDPGSGRELILGVGRADPERQDGSGRDQLSGCTVVFRQDGDFLYAGSTTPVATAADYEGMLTAQIRDALETYEREQAGDTLEHVVVQVFKRTGAREVRAALAALVGRSATLALLHVNRDAPLRLVNTDADGTVSIPSAGTVVALGPRDRLLITGEAGTAGDAHPLRLTLDAASTDTDLDRLVAQTYGLAAMSWRSYKRGREPVTISYGHALAAKVGALRPYGFDPTGLGRRPWFL